MSRPTRNAARRASSAFQEDAEGDEWIEDDEDAIQPIRSGSGNIKGKQSAKGPAKGGSVAKKSTTKRQARTSNKSRAAAPSNKNETGKEPTNDDDDIEAPPAEPTQPATSSAISEQSLKEKKVASEPVERQDSTQETSTASCPVQGTPTPSPRKPRLPTPRKASGTQSGDTGTNHGGRQCTSPVPSPRKPPTPKKTTLAASRNGRVDPAVLQPRRALPAQDERMDEGGQLLPLKRSDPPGAVTDPTTERRTRLRMSPAAEPKPRGSAVVQLEQPLLRQRQKTVPQGSQCSAGALRRQPASPIVPRARQESVGARREPQRHLTSRGEQYDARQHASTTSTPRTNVELSIRGEVMKIWRDVRATYQISDEMKGKMESVEVSIAEIRSLLMKSLESGPKTVQVAGGAGAVKKYENILSGFVPNAVAYFPDALWAEAMCWGTIEHVLVSSKYESITLDEFVVILGSITFSLAGNKSLNSFTETPEGELATKYRFIVLNKAFELAKSGTYPPVQNKKTKEALDPNPFWLGKDGENDYVQSTNIVTGQKQHEEIQSQTDDYKRRVKIGNGLIQPNAKDIADFLGYQIYKHMMEVFRKRRRRMRSDFTELYGYLFVSWKEHSSVCVDNSSIDMRWVQASADVKYEEISSIPETFDRPYKGKSTSVLNQELFSEYSRRPEITMWLSHDVVVTPGDEDDGQPKGSAGIVESYPHRLSLAAVSLGIIRGWSGYDQPACRLIKMHSHAMKVIYASACALREFTSIVKFPPMLDGLRTENPVFTNCTAKKVKSLRKFFSTFLTAPSNIGTVIAKATMDIPMESFNKTKRTLQDTIVRFESKYDVSDQNGRASEWSAVNDDVMLADTQVGEVPDGDEEDVSRSAGEHELVGEPEIVPQDEANEPSKGARRTDKGEGVEEHSPHSDIVPVPRRIQRQSAAQSSSAARPAIILEDEIEGTEQGGGNGNEAMGACHMPHGDEDGNGKEHGTALDATKRTTIQGSDADDEDEEDTAVLAEVKRKVSSMDDYEPCSTVFGVDTGVNDIQDVGKSKGNQSAKLVIPRRRSSSAKE